MKMNLKVAITFDGIIKVESTRESSKTYGQGQPRNFKETASKMIDLSHLECSIIVNEEVEDITPKEYIQAIGECIKTAIGGMFKSKIKEKEAEDLEIIAEETMDLKNANPSDDCKYRPQPMQEKNY